MKKFENLIWIAALVGPSLAFSQPPEEELTPTAPEFNIEVMDAPAPAETAPAAAPAAPVTTAPTIPTAPAAAPSAPIAEAKPAEAPKEDKSVKGVTLSPAVKIAPFYYSGERKQNYFQLVPSASLDATFKTGTGRDVALNLSYGLEWDEAITKRENGLRYFEHDFSGSASIDWTDSFSTSFSSGINYSLWASDSREHAIISDSGLMGKFKINDQVSISTGYRAFFFNDLDSQFRLSDGTFPGDADDLFTANSAIGGAANTYFDPLSNQFNYDPVAGHTWFTNNGLKIVPTAKIGSTSLKFDYEYVFYTFTNTPNTDWRGHFLTPSISQKLPWKGGSVSLKNQLRLRNYQTKTNGDGTSASNFRNRLTLGLGQSITDTINVEFAYRWQLSGSNADNYAAKATEHLINLGFNFSF